MRPGVSIVIAAFDEEATIAACVERVCAVYPNDAEVLVVDGGTDATGEVVREVATRRPAVRYIHNARDRGKGHAIRVGCTYARAPVIAQIDADLQFLPEELPRLLDPILRGAADVTLGSRFASGSRREPGSTPPLRTAGNKVISAFASLLSGQRFTDVQAGMKAWTADAIRTVDPVSDDYAYEVEIAVRAVARGLRVVEVPITTAARAGGESKVHVLRDGLPLLWRAAAFRLRR